MPADRDPRIDAYIRDCAAFARPVLNHLREAVHRHCPQVVETIKWGDPSFLYREKILCAMGSFKKHCVLSFWKGSQMAKDGGERTRIGIERLRKMTSVADLPTEDELAACIQRAMGYNEPGAPGAAPKRVRTKAPALEAPEDLMGALSANPKSLATFASFNPTNKREYLEWIQSARTQETRDRRIQTAVGWMAEGKTRYWKYRGCAV